MVNTVLQVLYTPAMPWLSVRGKLGCISLGNRSPLEINLEGSSVISRGLPSLDETLWQALVWNMPTPPFRHNQLGTQRQGFYFQLVLPQFIVYKKGIL